MLQMAGVRFKNTLIVLAIIAFVALIGSWAGLYGGYAAFTVIMMVIVYRVRRSRENAAENDVELVQGLRDYLWAMEARMNSQASSTGRL